MPRHIIRIECRTGLARESHGWQVRYKGTKFFSDWLRGDKDRTPATALELAVRYLAERYDGQSVPLRALEFDSKVEKTGMSGLRIVRYLNRRDFEEVYVEIAHPLKGRAPKRIYVGTCNTATQQRLDPKRIYVGTCNTATQQRLDPKRIYVGTCNTATQQRLDASLERGARGGYGASSSLA